MWCWHKWSRWEEISRSTAVNITPDEVAKMTKEERKTLGGPLTIRQERECKYCGAKQLRSTRTEA